MSGLSSAEPLDAPMRLASRDSLTYSKFAGPLAVLVGTAFAILIIFGASRLTFPNFARAIAVVGWLISILEGRRLWRLRRIKPSTKRSHNDLI